MFRNLVNRITDMINESQEIILICRADTKTIFT